jgi:hypothetical protein
VAFAEPRDHAHFKVTLIARVFSGWLSSTSGAHLSTYVVPSYSVRCSDSQKSSLVTLELTDVVDFLRRVYWYLTHYVSGKGWVLIYFFYYYFGHPAVLYVNTYSFTKRSHERIRSTYHTHHTVNRRHFMKTSNKPNDIASRTDLIDHNPSNVDNIYHLMLLYIFYLFKNNTDVHFVTTNIEISIWPLIFLHNIIKSVVLVVLIKLHSDETWIRVKLVNITLQQQLWNYGYANVTEHLTHEYITGPNRYCSLTTH